MTSENVTFASPVADAKFAQLLGDRLVNGILTLFSELSGWAIALTILLVLVAYDQSIYPLSRSVAIDADISTVNYVTQKGSIAGPSWKTPFIGPFLSSMNPKWEEYKGKWASGDLSCVSVFHKYVCQRDGTLCHSAEWILPDLW